MSACSACGNDEWDSGQIKLSWVGRVLIYQKQMVYFQSYDKKYNGKGPLAAARCLHCNHIKLTAAPHVEKYL